MNDPSEKHEELLKKISALQQRVKDLERSENDRSQTERNLKQRTDAIEASMDGIAILSEEQIYVYVNEAHAKVYGYDRAEELMGHSWQILYDEKELQRFNDDIMPEFMQNGRWRGEATGRKKDGSTFPQEVSLTALDNGGLICVVRDITERRQAEKALEEETIRRRILFEESPDGILIIDPGTARFIEFNTAAHRQLGYSREEFGNLSIFDLEAAETTEETKARIAGVIRNGRADFETMQRTRQGEVRNVHITAQIIDIQGNPVYHCVWRDITERRRTEEERERLILELKEALSQVKTLRGLVPICSSCKKIRNDKGYWEQLEVYIRDHSEAEFSHGICPECAQRLYSEFDKENKE